MSYFEPADTCCPNCPQQKMKVLFTAATPLSFLCPRCHAIFDVHHWVCQDNTTVLYYAREHNPEYKKAFSSDSFAENIDQLEQALAKGGAYKDKIHVLGCRTDPL